MNKLFTVTDLKQYFVCPRILYYHACLPDIRPITHKMEVGQHRHRTETPNANRRHYGIADIVNRYYDVPLKSESLGLSGRVDEIIEIDANYIPIDYKLSRKASQHFKLQVTAYAMLIEAVYDVTVEYGILYLMQARRHEQVENTAASRRKIKRTLDQMHHIANTQLCPAPTKKRYLCRECEFRRFCNDVS